MSKVTLVDIAPAYLVLEVIPPVGPGLLNTALLLEDGVLDHCAEHTEGHGDTVVIVAVDAAAVLEFLERLAVDLETVIELLGLNAELG